MNHLMHDPWFLGVMGVIIVSIIIVAIQALADPNFRFRTPPYYASVIPTNPPNLSVLTYEEVRALFLKVQDWQPSKWTPNPSIHASEPVGFVGHAEGIQLNLERDFRSQEPRFVVVLSSLGSYEECPGKFLGPFQMKYEQLLKEWWHNREVAAEAERLQEEAVKQQAAEAAVQAFRDKQRNK